MTIFTVHWQVAITWMAETTEVEGIMNMIQVAAAKGWVRTLGVGEPQTQTFRVLGTFREGGGFRPHPI